MMQKKVICCLAPLPAPEAKNLFYSLARAVKEETENDTVFVDLDLSCPDILTQTGLGQEIPKIKKGLDTLSTGSAPDLKKLLPVHEGVHLLAIDKETLEQKYASTDLLNALCEQLKERFSLVVVHCGNPGDRASGPGYLAQDKSCVLSDLILYWVPSLGNVAEANGFLTKQQAHREKIEFIVLKPKEGAAKILPTLYHILSKEPAYQVTFDQSLFSQSEAKPEIPQDLRRLARRISGISVGVAIGGGGVRAAGGIGVLDVLDQEGIPVDLIAGSSVGAVVACNYALGKTPAESAQCVRGSLDVRMPFNLFPLSNLYDPKNIIRAVKRYIGENTSIEELRIPTFIVSADLLFCREVVFSQGDLHLALQASTTIPALFPPVKYKGMLLVDGGIVNPVPGDIVKEKGAGICVAVSATQVGMSDLEKEKKRLQSDHRLIRRLRKIPFLKKTMEGPSIPNIITRSGFIPALHLLKNKRHLFDFHLRPDVMDYGIFDLENIERIVEAGRREGAKFAPLIKQEIRKLKQG